MRVLRIAGILSALAGVATASAQSVTAPGSCNLPRASGVSSEQLTSGQRQRTYRLFVPPAYDGRQRLPLVLDLHGSGGSPAGRGAQQRSRSAEQ